MLIATGVFVLFVVAASFVLWRRGTLMPLTENVLAGWGIGPVVLRDVYILKLPHLPPLAKAFWIVVTLLSVAGGGAVLGGGMGVLQKAATDLRAGRLGSEHAFPLFLAAGCAAYCPPLFLTAFLDRYLIPILPLLICLAATSAGSAMAGR